MTDQHSFTPPPVGSRSTTGLDDIATLFAEAIETEDPREREALLESLRQRDPALAREVTALVAAHFSNPAFLADPVGDEIVEVIAEHLDSALVGSRVGSWEIDALLHHGGMGTVYRAHRVEVDFQQIAALKVIRVGLGSPDRVRRFARERRLLARLEHPNIARLLDGGTTPDGLPYLVMEHVRGEPIDVWCARERPSLQRLLDVFARICSAVNFAHQNLVIHQDIKPSNILVEADGTPKLLDFGIAELESRANAAWEAEDAPEADGQGGRILTPAYASPEQFRGVRPDTSADTYSLGVLLYRLLTGETPYPVNPRSTIEEAERLARETVPDAPSARLDARGARMPRHVTDLDAIILRALRKNPEERYPSVLAFADDLVRYAEGEPVHARPPTLAYRATRFAGRNRAALGAAAAIMALLVSGLSVSLWQAGVAERQRDVARAEASTAASAVTFLKTVLGSADPWRDTEPAESVDDVIRIAEAQVDTVLADEPAARAYVLAALGEVAAGRGEVERADRLTGAAVAILEGFPAAENARTAEIYLTRALALQEDGRAREARDYAVEAVRRLDTRETDSPLELADALNQLAAIEIELGDIAAAEAGLRRAIDLRVNHGGRETLELAGVYNNLAVALATRSDRLDEAIEAYGEAARLVESLGASEPRLATLFVNQANVLRMSGRFDEAEAMFERAIRLMTGSLGTDHPATLTAAASFGSMYEAAGEFDKATATLRPALVTARASLSDDHPTTAYLENVLGAALCQRDGVDTLEEGLAVSRASLDSRLAMFGEEHWAVASGESIVGYCLTRLGYRDEGVYLLERAFETLRDQRGEDQELTVRARRWLEAAR